MGALIWRLLEEPKPLDVLLRELRGELQEVPSGFEDEIRQFLSELAERDLRSSSHQSDMHRAGRGSWSGAVRRFGEAYDPAMR